MPLTCHGHSRPVTHLSFSSVGDDDQYYLISACKGMATVQAAESVVDMHRQQPYATRRCHWRLVRALTAAILVPDIDSFQDWDFHRPQRRCLAGSALLGRDPRRNSSGRFLRVSLDVHSIGRQLTMSLYSKVWDTHSGVALHTLQHAHIVRAVAFPDQPSPQILATGGAEKKLRIFDLSRSSGSPSPTGSAPSTTDTSSAAPSYEIGAGVHQGTIKSIVWASDLNVLITASDDKSIRWWDLRARSPITTYTLDGLPGSCELDPVFAGSPTLGSAGSSTLSVAAGKTAYFFDSSRPGELIKSIKTPYELVSTALHSSQRKFITGSTSDTWVRVWDFDTEEVVETGKGHHGPVWSVAFSPDGKLYATGSEDGTIKLWKFTAGGYGLWR